MTLYISSFYKNIQKEFHTKDERKSRLIRTYEYFDRAKQNNILEDNQTSGGPNRGGGSRRLSYSKEPQIRKISKDINQMAISLDSGKRYVIQFRKLYQNYIIIKIIINYISKLL